jgi:single-stranded-DNA-specific exonuclease
VRFLGGAAPAAHVRAALAAGGVVHRILEALTRGDPEAAAVVASNLDLVALGTVADVVPLRGENRILTWHGLARMRETPRPAWPALAEACPASAGVPLSATAL